MLRRSFLLSGLSAGLCATTAQAEYSNIIDNKDLPLRNDLYAKFARDGFYSPDLSPRKVNLREQGMDVMVAISPQVTRAPLIVFSHDVYSSPVSYAALFRHWTTHGFCVIAPYHVDIEMNLPDATLEFAGNYSRTRDFNRRVEDCIIAKEVADKIGSTLKVSIESDSAILAGQGFGAMTAFLSNGLAVRTDNGEMFQFSEKLQQWSGCVAMSPPGHGILGIEEASWTDIKVPRLIMCTPKDAGVFAQSAEQRTHAFYFNQAPYRHLAFLKSGEYNIYTGQTSRPDTAMEDIFYDIKATINAFFVSYVHREEAAFKSLYDKSLMNNSYGYLSLRSA